MGVSGAGVLSWPSTGLPWVVSVSHSASKAGQLAWVDL